MPTVLLGFLATDLPFQDACSLSRLLHRGSGLGVLGAEGVGDALVGGLGLPIDAVHADLEQDGDAVPGAAGDLGGSLRESWRLTAGATRLGDRRPER